MPPKRKAASTKGKAPAGGKKVKKEEPEEEEGPKTIKDAISSLKAADANKKRSHAVDKSVPQANLYSVFEDYDCMLNQTNIGHNNNKYYVIQVLQRFMSYYTWNRWGRVGEPGANALKPFPDLASAKKDFEKKFSDKTKNKWPNKADFTPVPGKYTLIEMAGDEEDAVDAGPSTKALALEGKKVKKCELDDSTQKLVKLIFDQDMFKDAMQSFDIDVKKMPLGKISKTQIAKGFECLEELEEAINKKKPKNTLNQITSKFYTLIPHSFGRTVPPIIGDLEGVRTKMDMLMVLADIEIAQSMQVDKDKGYEDLEEVPHPLDVNYNLLKCKLELVDKKSKEFKILETYTKNTKQYDIKINDIWKIDRSGEGSRFKAHDSITNRKLLWHGTNLAVVAAILKSGLRIMPHSGGRVGAGIYFASENGKSAAYVRSAKKTGIMFLNEVALGKENSVFTNCTLRSAPKGYDSVVARGRTEPDPKKDTSLEFDGKKVIVPQGSPINTSHTTSGFYQSEYLVYKESQNRMRYLLSFTWPY